MNSEPAKNESLFVELLSKNHRRIMAFIYTLVPCAEDADDIMQETAKVAWEKFDQFKIGTNFVSWAVTIAKFQVLSYRKRYSLRVQFNDELLENLANQAGSRVGNDHKRLDALRNCIKHLGHKDRELVRCRFEEHLTAKILSKRFGVAMNTIYRNEARILDLLLNCVRKTLEPGKI